MAAAKADVPDRRLEGVHQLPDLYDGRGTRGGSTTATRRSRRSATRSSSRPSSSACRSSPPTRASRPRSATRRRTRRPPTSARRPRPTPTSTSSCTTPASRPNVTEGPYDEARRTSASTGSSRPCATNGVGPNQNVYAELGTTWWSLMADPDSGRAPARQAAALRRRGQRAVGHRLHLLRRAPGPDPGLPRVRDHAGVPGALRLPRADRQIKRKVLGLQRAPVAQGRSRERACEFSRDDLETIRRTIPTANQSFGRARRPSCARSSPTNAKPRASDASRQASVALRLMPARARRG